MVWPKISRVLNKILMVWRKLCRCDPENRWCDQNLDSVNKIFKSVINILMVWTKLWRCDFQNWWCEQIFFGVIKCWWCDETIFRCEQTSIFWKLCDHTVWCDLCTCFFLMLFALHRRMQTRFQRRLTLYFAGEILAQPFPTLGVVFFILMSWFKFVPYLLLTSTRNTIST